MMDRPEIFSADQLPIVVVHDLSLACPGCRSVDRDTLCSQKNSAEICACAVLTSQKGQQVAAWLLSVGLALVFLEAGNTAERKEREGRTSSASG